MYIPHQSTFSNKKLFLSNGLFDINFSIAADYEMLIRTLEKVSIKFFPIPIVIMKEGGISQRNPMRTFREFCDILEKHGYISNIKKTIHLFYLGLKYYLSSIYYKYKSGY